MERLHKSLILLLVAGIPAGAPSFFAASPDLCFTAGSVTYRLSQATSTPDFRVRIDNAAAHPDLLVQLVDRAEIADFVLVDDPAASAGSGCNSAGERKTVKIVPGPADLTIALTRAAENADFKLFVHSARVTHQDAAALYALMRHAETNTAVADDH